MNECRIGTIKTFHAETDVELILCRIHRALEVQTDVVQNETILELVVSDERGAVFMMRRAKVVEITALDVSV